MGLDRLWQLDVTGPASNSNYQSANIAESCPPSTLNNGLRALGSMAAREICFQGTGVSVSVSANIVTTTSGNFLHVLGTGNITSFGVVPGEMPDAAVVRLLYYASSASVSHSSGKITLIGAASRRIEPGDIQGLVHTGSSDHWREFLFSRADGSQVMASISATTITAGSISASAVSAVNMRASGAVSAASMSVTNIVLTGVTSLSGSIVNATTFQRAGNALTTLLQRVTVDTATYTSATANIPSDDTLPASTEGTQLFSQSFTPKNASSTIIIRCHFNHSTNSTSDNKFALFKGTTCVNAIWDEVSTGFLMPAALYHEEAAVNTTARTYSVRFGPGAGETMSINGDTARKLGGALVSYMVIEEWL